MPRKEIYLDHAAASPIDSRVVQAMAQASKEYGNPSAFNDAGRRAKALVEQSRKIVADFLHARLDEITFTASGSEANNLALVGYLRGKRGTVLTTPIEHPSVLECLKLPGIKAQFIKVSKDGLVDLGDLEKKLTKDILLVSVMYANNEIGTIQPIAKIGNFIKKFNKELPFHVDACQAAGFLNMNVQNLHADLVTFNGSKISGPRGIGVLYTRRGITLEPLVRGGGQERGLRAGTENMPVIAGLAKAIELIKPSDVKKIETLRDYAIGKIQKEIPEALLIGPTGDERLPNNIHICIPGLTSETMLLELDKYGISAGSGSACTSHAVEPSHVLKAIGVPKTHINGALRFSIGRETTKTDTNYLIRSLLDIIKDLRSRYK